MPLNIRIDGDLAILSNFGRLLNDPRHFDAGRDVRELLDRGHRHVVLELGGVREMGPTSIGLLTTLTRLVRQHGGEVVLANVGRAAGDYIEMMRMDTFGEREPGPEWRLPLVFGCFRDLTPNEFIALCRGTGGNRGKNRGSGGGGHGSKCPVCASIWSQPWEQIGTVGVAGFGVVLQHVACGISLGVP